MFLEFFCHLFYLQYFYDSVASKWQVTAGAEEIFCAFLYALKAWFMVMCVCVWTSIYVGENLKQMCVHVYICVGENMKMVTQKMS